MKKTSVISTIILCIIIGCGEKKRTTDDRLITVDLTANYPKKELILQDFMDVEYIPLETSPEFICQDLVLAISNNKIILKNYNDDGDIFIFDRTGKGIKKINRLGQSGEEYLSYRRAVIDEDKAEIFINDPFAGKIVVYDFDGNFKRNLKHNDDINFTFIYNMDHENLICNNNWMDLKCPFKVVSKQDAEVTEIQIPFEKKIQLLLEYKDEAKNIFLGATPGTYYPIIPDLENLILVEPSSDTIYKLLPNLTLEPIIVRTPSIASMETKVFLFMSFITDRYYFMEAVRKEFDFNASMGFPATDLMYDKQKKTIFEYTVYNDDYTKKTPVDIKSAPMGKDIAAWKSLDVHQLIEDYKKGNLKGKLKEIAAGLDENSNPVIMLVKNKK